MEKSDEYKMTPEEEAEWKKGLQPGGGWTNPKLLDENGNFDPSKLDDFLKDDNTPLPF
jgi:hypothetical protein